MSSNRINYRAIKHAYLYDSPQPRLEDLAEQYGCSSSSLRKRSADERWNELRVEAQRRADAKLAAKTEAEIANEWAEWDKRHLDGAKIIYFTAVAELQKTLNAARGMRDKNGNSMPDADLPASDLAQYSRMIETSMKIERTVHGRDVLKHEDVTKRDSPADALLKELCEEANIEIEVTEDE